MPATLDEMSSVDQDVLLESRPGRVVRQMCISVRVEYKTNPGFLFLIPDNREIIIKKNFIVSLVVSERYL